MKKKEKKNAVDTSLWGRVGEALENTERTWVFGEDDVNPFIGGKGISAITVKGFKAYSKWQRVKLKPITLLYGENSSGKSSILHVLDILAGAVQTRGSGRGLGLLRTDDVDGRDYGSPHSLINDDSNDSFSIGFDFKVGAAAIDEDWIKNNPYADQHINAASFAEKLGFDYVRVELDYVPGSQLTIKGVQGSRYGNVDSAMILQSVNVYELTAAEADANKRGRLLATGFNFHTEDVPLEIYYTAAPNKKILKQLCCYLRKNEHVFVDKLDLINREISEVIADELMMYDGPLYPSLKAHLGGTITQCLVDCRARHIKGIRGYRRDLSELSDLLYEEFSQGAWAVNLDDEGINNVNPGLAEFLHFWTDFETKLRKSGRLSEKEERAALGKYRERLDCEILVRFLARSSELGMAEFQEKYFERLSGQVLLGFEDLIANNGHEKYAELLKKRLGDQKINCFYSSRNIGMPARLYPVSDGLPMSPGLGGDSIAVSRGRSYPEFYIEHDDLVDNNHIKGFPDFLRSIVDLVDLKLGSELRKYRNMAAVRSEPKRWYHGGATMGTYEMDRFGSEMAIILRDRPEALEYVNGVLATMNVPYEVSSTDEHADITPFFQLLLRDKRRPDSAPLLTLLDVGYGLSQLLPLVVWVGANPDGLLSIEQPESQLHPGLQAELASFFADGTGKSNASYLIETHSEHFALRLLRLIRGGKLTPDLLAIYFVTPPRGKNSKGSSVHEMLVDDDGRFKTAWPGGFFPERMNELTGE